jgi:hypothetical protein
METNEIQNPRAVGFLSAVCQTFCAHKDAELIHKTLWLVGQGNRNIVHKSDP